MGTSHLELVHPDITELRLRAEVAGRERWEKGRGNGAKNLALNIVAVYEQYGFRRRQKLAQGLDMYLDKTQPAPCAGGEKGSSPVFFKCPKGCCCRAWGSWLASSTTSA